MRRLRTSLSTTDRVATAADFLASFPGREVLFIAPSRLAADEVVRALTIRAGFSFGIHRLTLPSLAVEMASTQLARDGISVLSGVAIEALAARAVATARARTPLTWFEPVAEAPGFFRALAATITELRMNGIDLETLASSGPAGHDLSRLMREFETGLLESRIADLAAIYQAASSASSRYGSMPILLMDVLPKCARERQFIEALVSGAPEVLATAHERAEPALKIAPEAVSPKTFLPDALGRLRSQVFSLSTPLPGELDSSVEFRSASDESREAVEVARSILQAAREGMPFDRMAVLFRNPDTYQPLIEDAMRRARIPAFYTQGSRRPNPAGRAFLALLACASEGLSASRFSEYLSLGQVPDPDEPFETPWVPTQGELFPPITPDTPLLRREAPVRAPQAWEHLVVDAAVIGGRDRWERRLRGLDCEIEKQIQEVRAEEEGRLEQLELRRARLRDLTRFVVPLIERLDALPSIASWGEWLTLLEQLASRSLKQPEGVLTALAELRPMSGIESVTLDEVREVLTNRLTFLRIEPAERRYGKVFVATIPESAGMSFANVYLPGLGEDIFPKRAFEDPLLLDEHRQRVSPDLATQDTRIADERLLFHLAAASAERTLFVSFPRMNLAQARARGPSFYALEVIRAITGRVPDLQELQRTAAESSQGVAAWPSPRNPADAIDDAEYDLALVGQLLRAPVEHARGRGRYLITANANLARSLRTRAGRWRRPWAEGDGLVDPSAETLAVLSNHRPAARPFSATALQQFAACPYRFLLHAVHRLQPRDEIVALERMDALTRGSLFHSIQFRILSELRDRDLLPVSPDSVSHVLTVADAVIDDVAGRYREELAPAIPRIWESEVEDIRWDIRGWLRGMAPAGGPTAWTPRWFELSFGLPSGRDSDPASDGNPVELPDGLKLRGSIDMIEERDGHLRVTDHKTGKAPAIPPGLTGRGEVLQPVLYALAAQALLGMPVDAARLSYCTERGGYRIVDVPITGDAPAALSKIISTIDESLRLGFLPAAPREGACNWCDYRVVCGPYEETRFQRKPKDRLAALEQVRKG